MSISGESGAVMPLITEVRAIRSANPRILTVYLRDSDNSFGRSKVIDSFVYASAANKKGSDNSFGRSKVIDR